MLQTQSVHSRVGGNLAFVRMRPCGRKIPAFAGMIVIFIFAFILAACGGGGGTPPSMEIPTPPPMGGGNNGNDETPEPTMKDCNGMQIPIAAVCPTMQTCPDGSRISVDDDCPSKYDTAEFRGNYALAEMGALYAYDNGYHGQGVTVIIAFDVPRHTHNDLSPNMITLPDEMNAWDGRDISRHGTNVAGIIGAARDGITMHGVAPSVKMVAPYSDIDYIAKVQEGIINLSGTGRVPGLALTSDIALITTNSEVVRIANLLANAYSPYDVVHVQSIGNNRHNTHSGTISVNAPHFDAHHPFIREDYEDNYLAVGALNSLTVAHGITNGCGVAKMWCIFAFGDRHTTTNNGSDTDYRPRSSGFSHTSAAAPHVAGALAVLKSAANELTPQMAAMTVVRLILLETATPLYADATKNGVRMTMQNGEPVLSSVYGWGLVNISAGVSHLQSINMQMSALKDMANVRLDAAKFAVADKFAAADENAFRFWGGMDSANRWTGIATKEVGGVFAFGEYGESDLRINSFLPHGEIANAESKSWTAGMQFANVWRPDDNLRLVVREESPINSGDLVLHYSFGKQIRLPLKQKPQTIYALGYSRDKWRVAAQYNAQTNAKGFSAEIVVRF